MPSHPAVGPGFVRSAACILGTLCIMGSALASPPSGAGRKPTAQPGTFTIEVQQGGGGSVVPDGFVSVPAGGSQAFDFIPDDCYQVGDVMVDGESVGGVAHYTFTNVQSDHVIYVAFVRLTFTILATSGPGGTMVPSGVVSMACGTDVTFDTQGTPCTMVTDLTVDGVSLGPLTSYTFTNVRADHSILATFGPGTTSTSLSVTPMTPSCAVPETLVAHVTGPASVSTIMFK